MDEPESAARPSLREKVVDIGPLEVTHDERESVPLPPIIGGICLVAGVLLLIGGNRKVA